MSPQIETLKTELREFITLSETITPGRWAREASRAYCTDECITYNVVGPPSDYMYLQEESDATFIARSRNISPTMAKMLLVAVKGLERLYNDTEGCADGAPDASGHDRLCNEVSHTLKHQLQQILNLWNETK
jgi:hypothetical protein